MVEDFFNGLNIVPLPPGNEWMTSAANIPFGHPFLPLLRPRIRPDVSQSAKSPESDQPPLAYTKKELIQTPMKHKENTVVTGVPAYETVFLQDVEAFQEKTSNSVKMALGLSVQLRTGFKVDVSRPVIYRYIDVIKSSFALLEAIHFELFMPDRPDLRFLAVPNAVEGDYFHVAEADLLSDPSFAVKLGEKEYPVVWEARDPVQMAFHDQSEKSFLVCVMKKKQNIEGGEMVVSADFPSSLFLRSSLLADLPDLRHGTLLRVSTWEASAAHIYAVEPIGPTDRRKDVGISGMEKYFKLVNGVRTSSQRVGRIVSAVRALSASETAQIEDRLGDFTGYRHSSTKKLMRDLFRLGCLVREAEASEADADAASDAADARALDSAVVEFLAQDFTPRNESKCLLIDAVYGREQIAIHRMPIECVRAPPGSRATAEAAAMAAVPAPKGGCQIKSLLLAVRNATVDGLGTALKEMGFRGRIVYNMKSDKKLDPHNPAPFDFFDLMKADELEKWKSEQPPTEEKVVVPPSTQKKKGQQKKQVESDHKSQKHPESSIDIILSDRREWEKKMSPKIVLSTPDIVLQEKLKALEKVTQVIILEANLLTEAAFFCLMRRFPDAQMVLIGDDHQLPPFMYDEKILGHEWAGRSAFSVAIKNGRVPVTELNEVYRAPQSLVAPYNRLAYGGRLVSKVAEDIVCKSPLSMIGLIPLGLPQLLLIDIEGNHDREEKLVNKKEINVLERLLSKLPKEWKNDIMIISLYKGQMRRIQVVAKDYTVLTVDSAQDQEKPIVIVLTSQISLEGDLIHSVERCNVAVSRQQKALIILGSASILTTTEPWSRVVNCDDFTRIKAKGIKLLVKDYCY